MVKRVNELESVNSREVIDFVSQEYSCEAETVRHKVITSEEFDRLARKNSTQSTNYQTNWAIKVIKGNYNVFLCYFNGILKQFKTLGDFHCGKNHPFSYLPV